jgi:hypothetical protein
MLLLGCERPDDHQVRIWLQSVRAVQASADCRQSLADLEKLIDAPAPLGLKKDHRRIVLQDGCYLVARCFLNAGKAAQARQAAERGLALGRASDVFTTNLWIVLGRACEALGQEKDAVRAYGKAMDITELLLQRALKSEGRGETP